MGGKCLEHRGTNRMLIFPLVSTVLQFDSLPKVILHEAFAIIENLKFSLPPVRPDTGRRE